MATVNLLRPRLPAPQTVRLRRVAWAGGVLSGLFLCTLVAYGWLTTSQEMLNREVAGSRGLLAAERRNLARWQALVAADQLLARREELLAQVLGSGDRFARLLGQMALALPPEARLTQVQIGANGAVNLGGVAENHGAVAVYVSRLREVPELSGVWFRSSVRAGTTGELRFTIQARLAGAAAAGSAAGSAAGPAEGLAGGKRP